MHTTQAQKQKPQDKHYIKNTFLSVLYLEIQFSGICCLFSGQIIHQRKACFHVTLSDSVMRNLKSITVICWVRNRTNPKGLQFSIRTWAGIRYANVGGMNINDPNCNVTVSVMLGFAYFSVVFCTHEIYIRRKQWCLRLTVCHFHVQNSYYSTMPR